MIRKSGNRFSEKIMLKQRDQHVTFDEQVHARIGKPIHELPHLTREPRRSEMYYAASVSSPGGGRAYLSGPTGGTMPPVARLTTYCDLR
jgi:hypothetical protein